MAPEKLVMMANQIGTFFASQKGDVAREIAAHLRSFWEPRMRSALYAHLDKGGEGLHPAVRRAIETMREADKRAA